MRLDPCSDQELLAELARRSAEVNVQQVKVQAPPGRGGNPLQPPSTGRRPQLPHGGNGVYIHEKVQRLADSVVNNDQSITTADPWQQFIKRFAGSQYGLGLMDGKVQPILDVKPSPNGQSFLPFTNTVNGTLTFNHFTNPAGSQEVYLLKGITLSVVPQAGNACFRVIVFATFPGAPASINREFATGALEFTDSATGRRCTDFHWEAPT